MRVSVNLNAQKPDTTTNAVIYARYSSHGQTEQSIEGQLAKGHEYAAAQGYTVVHEYIDRAMTGRNDNREAFQKMLSDTGKHQFQVVIVWKVDRFGRNREEIAFNKHTCKKNGVRVEYVAESLPNSPEAVILESVLEGMAEYYSIQLSQNIRRGQLESAKKCQCVGGSVPLGYTLDSDKHFVIDPQTAPVVKKIFDLYAEGATISEITGQLNEQGIRTARKQLFTKNSLTKLLKNEKYIGVYTYKDIVRVEGGVPAIVDESTFDRVQELLKINRRAPSHTWTKVEYLLTDKLFCGHCGSPMVGESGFSHTGAKYSYYGCIKRRREKACDKKPVRQDWIEALVLDETVKLLHDDELMEYIIDRTWEYYQVTDKVQEEKAVLEAQLAEVDKAINNLVRAIEAGIFNAATKSRMDELDAQKAALTASLADLELTSGIRITRDHIEYFLLRLRDLDVKDRECQKRLVQTFVNAVFIYDDGRVKITYNYSGQSSTITLNQIASAEKGKGFVCCLPCSTFSPRFPRGVAALFLFWGKIGRECCKQQGISIYYFSADAVNAGVDTGYAKQDTISGDDKHFGWRLGRFFLTGFTRVTADENQQPVFIKTLGDSVTLWFDLEQDIDALNGNAQLSLAADANGYDQQFGIPKTNFGRGTLIVRHTDYQNAKGGPAVYTDYLLAKGTTGANTRIVLHEEGDYEVALDYEVQDSELTHITSKFGNYRIFLRFSIRNGNCMVYPFDLLTGAELQNTAVAEAGFSLDLARSRYLDINVRRAVLVETANGVIEDERFNRPAKDGDRYTQEGIYTISVSNRYTGESTTKTIFVGSQELLETYVRNGFSLERLK